MQVAICDMIWINFMKDYLLNFIFQLRYLQTLNSISAENNSTVIFPVPIDIINSFMTPTPNNNLLPFQHYNLHQRAQMMNVKQRPPLVPTHSKVSKVSNELASPLLSERWFSFVFKWFIRESKRDLIQNRKGLIELQYCLLLCSVLLEVSNDNDSKKSLLCTELGDAFDPLSWRPRKKIYLYLSLLTFAGGRSEDEETDECEQHPWYGDRHQLRGAWPWDSRS